MNAPTVPNGKPAKKTPTATVKAPKKGADYTVATESRERPGGFDVIMSVTRHTIEY